MKCVVTGATGFIGRELCCSLIEAGCEVLPLSRSGSTLPDGTTTLGVDLAGASPDAALFDGVDVVVHLAGIAHQQAPAADYTVVNVEGTLALARAAAQAGVLTFIFVSSVKAMGPADHAGARNEDDCAVPGDPYGRSKRQAELALAAMHDQFSALHIVRPALVYGHAPKGNIQLLARAVRVGLPRPPDLGRRSMVALDDLVALLQRLAMRPPPGLHTWIACAAQPHSTREIYDLLRSAYGKGRGLAWLPQAGWRLAAALLDLRAGEPVGTFFDKMFGDEVYDSARVTRDMQWHAATSLAEAIDGMGLARRGGR